MGKSNQDTICGVDNNDQKVSNHKPSSFPKAHPLSEMIINDGAIYPALIGTFYSTLIIFEKTDSRIH